MAQRSEKMSMPLKWEFPGGKLAPNESAAVCLGREIDEELGIDIIIRASLPPSEWSYEAFTICLHPFVCATNGSAITLAEHKKIRWLAPEELPSLDWAEADGPVLRAYLLYLQTESETPAALSACE